MKSKIQALVKQCKKTSFFDCNHGRCSLKKQCKEITKIAEEMGIWAAPLHWDKQTIERVCDEMGKNKKSKRTD